MCVLIYVMCELMHMFVCMCVHVFVCVYTCACMLELSDYFHYIKCHGIFFTIVMLMLVCHNRDSYSM